MPIHSVGLAKHAPVDVVPMGRAVADAWVRSAGAVCEAGSRNILVHPLAREGLRRSAAALEVAGRVTRHYGRPEWDIPDIKYGEEMLKITPRTIPVEGGRGAFINVTHFERSGGRDDDPVTIVYAPISGHYATLVRQTVKDLLARGHNVYVTEHKDASTIPLSAGRFDLHDFTDFTGDAMRAVKAHSGAEDTYLISVCQPATGVAAKLAMMDEDNDPALPAIAMFSGGPFDVARSDTVVTKLARERGMDWFRSEPIHMVPFPHAGVGREVYPGVLQLTGFMGMNLERHIKAHQDLFQHLITGDTGNAARNKAFYDEYLSVLDLTAEFYLQTVDTVFIQRAFPRGVLNHRGRIVNPKTLKHVKLITAEGGDDDITGTDQCHALHDIVGRPHDGIKITVPGIGHYGVFSGSGWRNNILPVYDNAVREHRAHKLQLRATAANQNRQRLRLVTGPHIADDVA